MPQSDPLQILLAHDHWASGELLDACGKITAEQFHQPFPIGPGSLHDTLTHMIGVLQTWTHTLTGREPGPRLEADGRRRSPGQLRPMLDEASRALAAEAPRRPLAELTTRRLRDGRTIQLTRAAILTHATTHGTHHRAQCLNMLKQLGVKPLPLSSVAEWAWTVDREG